MRVDSNSKILRPPFLHHNITFVSLSKEILHKPPSWAWIYLFVRNGNRIFFKISPTDNQTSLKGSSRRHPWGSSRRHPWGSSRRHPWGSSRRHPWGSSRRHPVRLKSASPVRLKSASPMRLKSASSPVRLTRGGCDFTRKLSSFSRKMSRVAEKLRRRPFSVVEKFMVDLHGEYH